MNKCSNTAVSLILTASLMLLTACHDDADGGTNTTATGDGISCTELIYCHPGEEESTRKVVEYALSKINEAQKGLSFKVDLHFDYANDDEEHFSATASNYLLDDKYGIIIAPSNAEKALLLLNTAGNCFGDNVYAAKGIIFPSLTSNEVQRVASTRQYTYCLSSDDRNLFLVALQHMHSLNPKYVNLICTDDDYGNTFSRFFGLYSSLAGYSWVTNSSLDTPVNGLIQVTPDITRYNLTKTLTDIRLNVLDTLTNKDELSDYSTYIVASSNPEHGVIVDSLVNAWRQESTWKDNGDKNMPHVIVIDADHTLKNYDKYNNAIAYSMSPDPTLGDFVEDFHNHFGYYPIHGEAFIYDAVLMAFYAEYARQVYNHNHQQSTSTDEPKTVSGGMGLLYVNNGKDEVEASWNTAGITNVLQAYIQDNAVKARGVTSDWDATNSTYYAVLLLNKSLASNYTTCPLWWFRNNSDDELTLYLNNMEKGWEPTATDSEDLGLVQKTRDVPQLNKRWALLVAGTLSTEKGFWGQNYRHQGDVWNMYHMLRTHGYDENHIIVVTEDDIFGVGLFGEQTDEKVIKCLSAGDDENLYEEIASHYKLSDLTQQDILDIIAGRKSDRLPYVIESTSADDVLIYWSGHGNEDDCLRWDGQDNEGLDKNRQGQFTSDMLWLAIESMQDKDTPRYRRMLCIVEACHSGHIIGRMPKMDNVLYMAAAEDESSWSDTEDCISVEGYGNIYLFDEFSKKLVQNVSKTPEMSLYSLYTKLYDSTTGSHPTIYNSANYGNLFNLTFAPDF